MCNCTNHGFNDGNVLCMYVRTTGDQIAVDQSLSTRIVETFVRLSYKVFLQQGFCSKERTQS